MNSLNKLLLSFTTLSALGACSGKNGGGNDGGTVPPVDQNIECIERQKKALTDAGLSLTGGADELKKLTAKSTEFYQALPFCSP